MLVFYLGFDSSKAEIFPASKAGRRRRRGGGGGVREEQSAFGAVTNVLGFSPTSHQGSSNLAASCNALGSF